VDFSMQADDRGFWHMAARTAGAEETEPERTLVTLSDSVADDDGSLAAASRWPGLLARRLKAHSKTQRIAVLNRTVGRHTRLLGELAQAALDGFERGVLAENGVAWLVVQAGVHDIGASRDASVAMRLTEAYEHLIERAHARNIRIYGIPILPFGLSKYASYEHELARQRVNEWIRTSGRFDAVIDFDQVLRDEKYPVKLAAAYDDGDHLQPNAQGHRKLAEAVDLALFSP
jgi:lysophospholipase L1-like esterase